ncbi:MAG: tetratricopeptide repeat protein, partial [Bacteroidales bacterium]|nr:tetratricopeptide repeat protein [Bacteroidales bacterium]
EIIEKSGIEEGLKKYYDLKSIPCDDILFTETSINHLGHKYLKAGDNSNAIEIFKLNTKEYPDSWNAYDSLGEAYMKNGDKRLAKKNYKKSIKLNPENLHAEEMLTNL